MIIPEPTTIPGVTPANPLEKMGMSNINPGIASTIPKAKVKRQPETQPTIELIIPITTIDKKLFLVREKLFFQANQDEYPCSTINRSA